MKRIVLVMLTAAHVGLEAGATSQEPIGFCPRAKTGGAYMLNYYLPPAGAGSPPRSV